MTGYFSEYVGRVIAQTDSAMINPKHDLQAASYQDADPVKLLNQFGEFATTTRRERDRMQRDLLALRQRMNLKLRNSIIVAIVTAVVVRAPEIAMWTFRHLPILRYSR